MQDAAVPTITAHAGCDGTAENTVESARKGLALGADLVEVDVRADPDGRLFLWHHDAVPLAGGGAVPVSTLRLRELRRLEEDGRIRFDRPGGRITVFEDLASVVEPGAGRINLDLKDDRSAELIPAAVRAAGLERRVVLTGCGMDRARLARIAGPRLPVFLNTDFRGTPPSGLSRERLDAECAAAVQAGCCGLNIHYRFCTPLLVDAARARSLQVSVWTVGPEQGIECHLGMGIDNLTTRHVAEAVRIRSRMRR